MNAEDNVRLTALADLFPDHLEAAKKDIRKRLATSFQVSDDQCFVGFDAYQKLIDSDVDVVLLATSPHYRPQHLRAAIDAGKHVFCEKPVAVDPVGVRSVLETTSLPRRKDSTSSLASAGDMTSACAKRSAASRKAPSGTSWPCTRTISPARSGYAPTT